MLQFYVFLASTLTTTAYARSTAAWLSSQRPIDSEDFGNSRELRSPQPPTPEPINVVELPLPPVAPSSLDGSCTWQLNPKGTGCINQTTNLQSGSFTADGDHVTATVEFVGAPASPDLRSVYVGLQIILIKADGTLFPNGDPWRCLTCGIPPENAQESDLEKLDYPQAFRDGKRLLAGTNIIDCGPHDLTSLACTPDKLHIYPIHWTTTTNEAAPSAPMRELRIHPDDTHLAWSSFSFSSSSAGQFSYLGRLAFRPCPTTSTGTPLAPRYELTNVNLLLDPTSTGPIYTTANHELHINTSAITIGEARGFSGTGRELTYIGYPHESCNIDLFAIDLFTGHIRRLTSYPEYTDPVDISPDDKWHVVMDTRGSGRQMFLSGMRGIPPIIDSVVTSITASTRNNRQRRFFQPWLIDHFGDRGEYFGQQVNGQGDGSAGSINDVDWNGLADPKWSLDGTRIVYHQGIVQAPACGEGNANALVCPNSTADGGRTMRVMLATVTSRRPLAVSSRKAVEAPDVVPWAMRYVPGGTLESGNGVSVLPGGNYMLYGKVSGSANVSIVLADKEDLMAIAGIESITITYANFSDGFEGTEGLMLDGSEKVSARVLSATLHHVDWQSDLTQTNLKTGATNAKKTSPDGFHLSIDIMQNVFEANGTLTTTVDGVMWKQPENGT